MNQTHRKTPLIFLLLLILVGTCAFVFAFWLIDHRQAIPNSEVVLAISMGVFFLAFVAAFMLFLWWRDNRRATSARSAPSAMSYRPELEGTVYGLAAGIQYRVIKSFVDFYGNAFEQGETLRFKERHFLPYEGGHTIVFDERSLYLQEDKDKEILDNFSKYIVQIEDKINL